MMTFRDFSVSAIEILQILKILNSVELYIFLNYPSKNVFNSDFLFIFI